MTIRCCFMIGLIFSSMALALPLHDVSTRSITVGQPFVYQVVVPLQATASYTPNLGAFEVVSASVKVTATSRSYWHVLRAFHIDPLRIPTQTISIADTLIDLPSIPLQLQSLLPPNQQQLNDVAPILPIPTVPWIWVITLSILTVIIGIGFLLLKRKKNTQSVAGSPIQIPPFEQAMQSLLAIMSPAPSTDAEIKKAYFACTDIICQFLDSQFGLDAVDATTTEIARQIKNHPQIPPDCCQNLMAILTTCDTQKFSKSATQSLTELSGMISTIQTWLEALPHDA